MKQVRRATLKATDLVAPVLFISLAAVGGCKQSPSTGSAVKGAAPAAAGYSYADLQQLASLSECGTPQPADPALQQNEQRLNQLRQEVLATQTPNQDFAPPKLPPLGSLIHNLIQQHPRTVNGRDNNHQHPDWAAASTPYIRDADRAFYEQPGNRPRGSTDPNDVEKSRLPSGREISTKIFNGPDGNDADNQKGASDWLWQWGQFTDHDLDLAEPPKSPEDLAKAKFNISTAGVDKDIAGNTILDFNRNVSRTDDQGVPQQVNELTHYIDSSNVYGSDAERCRAERTMTAMIPFDADGQIGRIILDLKDNPRPGFDTSDEAALRKKLAENVEVQKITSRPEWMFFVQSLGVLAPDGRMFINPKLHDLDGGELLPQNFRFGPQEELRATGTNRAYGANDRGPMSILPAEQFWLGGDIRVSEQFWLTGAHTLMVREHNRIAAAVKAQMVADGVYRENDQAVSNAIFEITRSIVNGEAQNVTWREFLPILIGKDEVPVEHLKYRDDVNATISNVFATAVMRMGHTLVSPQIEDNGRRQEGKIECRNENGCFRLRDAFFTPTIVREFGLEAAVLRLAEHPARKGDGKVNSDFINMLFPAPLKGQQSKDALGRVLLDRNSPREAADLIAINIQRGRDHGLPPWMEVRRAMAKLRPRYAQFLNAPVQFREGDEERVKSVKNYPLEEVDPFVALVEEPVFESHFGPTFTSVLADDFIRKSEGDRYFFTNGNIFDNQWVTWLEAQSLTKIVKRNIKGADRHVGKDIFCVDKSASHYDSNGGVTSFCKPGGADANTLPGDRT
jgi:hypothetical protein